MGGLWNIPAKRQEPLTFFHISFHEVCFYECLSYLIYKWGLQTVGVIRFTQKRAARSLLSGSTASKSRKGGSAQCRCQGLEVAFLSHLLQPDSGGSAPRSLLPARLLSGALRREENRRILAGSGRSRTRARPHPRPAPSRWLQSASRLRPGGEAPGVAKGSRSRERRSLTYFPSRQAHAYLRGARLPGGSRGIARAGCSPPRARGGARAGRGRVGRRGGAARPTRLPGGRRGRACAGVERADPAALALILAALERCFGAPGGFPRIHRIQYY